MQPGCDEIEFLISKYVDGEATPEERALVDDHVAGCDSCAWKLTAFMEMAAIFSEAPNRLPDPLVRSNVFTDIHRLKEAERRREEVGAASSRPYIAPIFAQPSQVPSRKPSLASRLWSLGALIRRHGCGGSGSTGDSDPRHSTRDQYDSDPSGGCSQSRCTGRDSH